MTITQRSSRFVRPALVGAMCAVLGTAACSGPQDTKPAETVTQTVHDSAEPSSSATDENADRDEQAAQGEHRGEPQAEAGGPIAVTAVENRGKVAVQLVGDAPGGDFAPTSEKLVIGNGGCFGVSTHNGPPRLAVFPNDAHFVLEHGKPSASFGGKNHFVGEQISGDALEVPMSQLTGVPERCADNRASTALVFR